jgi:hypothetical protein
MSEYIYLGLNHSISIAGLQLLIFFWTLLKKWGQQKFQLILVGVFYLSATAVANVLLITGAFDFFTDSHVKIKFLYLVHFLLAFYFARQAFITLGRYCSFKNSNSQASDFIGERTERSDYPVIGIATLSFTAGFIITMSGWIWPRDLQVFLYMRSGGEQLEPSSLWRMLGLYIFFFLLPLLLSWVLKSMANDFQRFKRLLFSNYSLILMAYSGALFASSIGTIYSIVKQIL